ncbi:putative nitrogen fixation protein NifT [Neorhizobium huautlense]|uniref:putative nitrogen fixation protein NifT n=1 Tax=Neorhizobium huautlense TaxID=67774 RepID=UPI000CF9F850|nr:putative nitrogen fixation protein NifT [Neorhizobium huautlense]
MRVTIRRTNNGLSAYVPRKDLEEPIIGIENESLWGGFVELANGWRFLLPELPKDTPLPMTVEARKIVNDDAGTVGKRDGMKEAAPAERTDH